MDKQSMSETEKIELYCPRDGKRWTLGDTCVIGRHPSTDIQLAESKVSREHAMLRRQGDTYTIYDLDSANGTSVNGVAVSAPVALKNGDRVSIADIPLIFSDGGPILAEPNLREPQSENATIMISVQRLPMIILVADLQGYTAMAAQISEEELAALISPWYVACRDLLLPSGATIDKFIGDCVFAYWHTTDAATRAVAVDAAEKLAARGLGVTPEIEERFRDKHITPECGVGLHVGEAAVGALSRGNRTALGDAVNLTFRIEALTRELDASVLATTAFLDGWPEGAVRFKSMGAQNLKGYAKPVEVFSLITNTQS